MKFKIIVAVFVMLFSFKASANDDGHPDSFIASSSYFYANSSSSNNSLTKFVFNNENYSASEAQVFISNTNQAFLSYEKVDLLSTFSYSQFPKLKQYISTLERYANPAQGFFHSNYRKAYTAIVPVLKKHNLKLNQNSIKLLKKELLVIQKVYELSQNSFGFKIPKFDAHNIPFDWLATLQQNFATSLHQVKLINNNPNYIDTSFTKKYNKVNIVKTEEKPEIKQIDKTTYNVATNLELTGLFYNGQETNIAQNVKAPFTYWNNENINNYGVDVSDLDTVLLELPKNFVMPFTGNVTSPFGIRRGRMHTGTDINLEKGDTVYAAFDGKVRVSMYHKGYGNCVVLAHENGLETLYAHFHKCLVKAGTEIKAGQAIGLGGSTGWSSGSHLHWEARWMGEPFDVMSFVNFEKNELSKKSLVVSKALYKGHKHTHNYKKQYISSGKTTSNYNSNSTVYYVKSGDTLGHIAQKTKVSIGKLCFLNGITTKTTLQIGQKLRLK